MTRKPRRPRAVPEQPMHRYVPPGGMSRTIRGALKILIGVIVKISGWALSNALQEDIIEGLALLIGIGLDLWGVGQIYHARQSRGDLSPTGQRVAAVEVIVQPENPLPVPPELD